MREMFSFDLVYLQIIKKYLGLPVVEAEVAALERRGIVIGGEELVIQIPSENIIGTNNREFMFLPNGNDFLGNLQPVFAVLIQSCDDGKGILPSAENNDVAS